MVVVEGKVEKCDDARVLVEPHWILVVEELGDRTQPFHFCHRKHKLKRIQYPILDLVLIYCPYGSRCPHII